MNLKKKLIDHKYDEYITTLEFYRYSTEVFDERLKQANLVTKTDFDDKLKSQNQKVNSSKTKHLLVENEFFFCLNFLRGKNHFEEDGIQIYLVFQLTYRYIKMVIDVGSGGDIYFWTSKGFNDENITAPTASDYNLNPQLSYFSTKTRVEFNGSYLKQGKIMFDYGKVVNIYFVYKISKFLTLVVIQHWKIVYLVQLV